MSEQKQGFVEDLLALEEKGIDIDIIASKEQRKDDFDQLLKAENGIRLHQDQDGNKFTAFGLSEKRGCLLFYLTESRETLSASKEIDEIQSLRDELLRLSVNPLIVQKPLIPGKKSELSGLGQKIADFPFDSLINQATTITVDLDDLPERKMIKERTIGNAEFPKPDEPVFALISGIAAGSDNRIFISDHNQYRVFVVNTDGEQIAAFGQKGMGPGEMSCKLLDVDLMKDRILVADGCYKLYAFDWNLEFLRSFHMDIGIQLFSNFTTIGNVLLIPSNPIPPNRTKIVHIYEIAGEKLSYITSFFDYLKPSKQYSNLVGALWTHNGVRVGSDGSRYFAIGRPREQQITIIDIQEEVSYRFRFIGEELERRSEIKLPQGVPDFAGVNMFIDFIFDTAGNFYVLLPESVLVMNVNEAHKSNPYKYHIEAAATNGANAAVHNYRYLAVTRDSILLASPGDACLTIFKRL